MPLKPNLIERQLIRAGVVPWPLLDIGLSTFMIGSLLAAAELGVFEALAEDRLNLEGLAEKTGADPDGLVPMLRVLVALDYVEELGEEYTLTKQAKRSVPIEWIGAMVPFLRDQVVTTAQGATRGVREAPEDGVAGWERVQSGPIARSYQIAMRWLASGTVDEVAKKVKLPGHARRLLDVGGAHGLYPVAFCRKTPNLRGTVLDWPIGLESARQTLEENPDLADRIDLVERDFEREELPDGYDVVMLGNIIHGINADGNRELFQKIARATNEDAMIVIVDQFAGVKGSKFSRSVAALVGFNLFLWSGGRAYEADRVSRWLAEAGFHVLDRKALRTSPGFSLLTARKRA